MNAKIVKYLLCIYTLSMCMYANGQSLTGDVRTVQATGNLYPYFKDIAYDCIVGAFFIQVAVMIYVVSSNGGKAKKAVKQLVVSTAVTGLIWAWI